MESIYYVLSWLCHRSCEHCYEDRFHPYHGSELERVVAEARANYASVIGNFPERMTYLDLNDPDPTGQFREKVGRVILAGGEILLKPIREPVLYPALDLPWQRDTVSARQVEELLERKVWMISVSGMDAYHQGLEQEADRKALQDRLVRLFESRGMRLFAPAEDPLRWGADDGPWFHFFGATPDSWIGKLWPRGRAQANDLSTAGIADNFCNRWSGGLNFLQYHHSGSEVSVEPNGNVYPCCIKTKVPIGNLLAEKLEVILERLIGNPVYEAISMGHPERMGLDHGWSMERFLENQDRSLVGSRLSESLHRLRPVPSRGARRG